jgi:hypothetical protein
VYSLAVSKSPINLVINPKLVYSHNHTRDNILPVVLYGCETTSLTLTEEQRLRAFENSEHRILRRIFGPKRKEVIGHWRKLQSEKLHDLYS